MYLLLDKPSGHIHLKQFTQVGHCLKDIAKQVGIIESQIYLDIRTNCMKPSFLRMLA